MNNNQVKCVITPNEIKHGGKQYEGSDLFEIGKLYDLVDTYEDEQTGILYYELTTKVGDLLVESIYFE